jgi:hypothetical protein
VSRYVYAEDDECGLEYRPGEMSAPERNYCRLAVNHPSKRHSTRRWRHDDAGFEWIQQDEPELEWPVRAETEDL